MDHYAEQARQFCLATKTYIGVVRSGVVDRFPGENKRTGCRFKYDVTFKRNGKRYETVFYDSIANSNANRYPTTYSLLACLQKYDPGRFWDFIREFGFEISSEESFRHARTVYKSCVREYRAVKELFGDVMERLQEFN
jgi:hypothetical protein